MADLGTSVDCVPCQQNSISNVHLPGPAEVESVESGSTKYDPLDPSTFVPPSSHPGPSITIEFCDRCRWLHRASWVSTELFLTFPSPTLKAITLMPLNADETAGRFRVWLFLDDRAPILMWDRKFENGFPELKVLSRELTSSLETAYQRPCTTWEDPGPFRQELKAVEI